MNRLIEGAYALKQRTCNKEEPGNGSTQTTNSPRVVETGCSRTQGAGAPNETSQGDRENAEAFGRSGSAKGLFDRNFLENHETSRAQIGALRAPVASSRRRQAR